MMRSCVVCTTVLQSLVCMKHASWRSGSSASMAHVRRTQRSRHCESICSAFSNTIALSAKTRMTCMAISCRYARARVVDWFAFAASTLSTKLNAEAIFFFLENGIWKCSRNEIRILGVRDGGRVERGKENSIFGFIRLVHSKRSHPLKRQHSTFIESQDPGKRKKSLDSGKSLCDLTVKWLN